MVKWSLSSPSSSQLSYRNWTWKQNLEIVNNTRLKFFSNRVLPFTKNHILGKYWTQQKYKNIGRKKNNRRGLSYFVNLHRIPHSETLWIWKSFNNGLTSLVSGNKRYSGKQLQRISVFISYKSLAKLIWPFVNFYLRKSQLRRISAFAGPLLKAL